MEHEYIYHYSFSFDENNKKMSISKSKDKIVKETAKTVVYRACCTQNDYTKRKSDLDVLNDFLGMWSLNPNAEAQYIELLKSDLDESIAKHQARIDWARNRLCALENCELNVNEKF